MSRQLILSKWFTPSSMKKMEGKAPAIEVKDFVKQGYTPEAENGGVLASIKNYPLAYFDIPTANRQIFEQALWQRLHDDDDLLFRMQQAHSFFGEASHQDNLEVMLPLVSHAVTDFRFADKPLLVGDVDILDTPMGNIIYKLMKSSYIGISSRGYGTLTPADDGENQIVSAADYVHVCWDFVGVPAVKEAMASIAGYAKSSKLVEPIVRALLASSKHDPVWGELAKIIQADNAKVVVPMSKPIKSSAKPSLTEEAIRTMLVMSSKSKVLPVAIKDGDSFVLSTEDRSFKVGNFASFEDLKKATKGALDILTQADKPKVFQDEADQKWYFEINSHKYGPFDSEELARSEGQKAGPAYGLEPGTFQADWSPELKDGLGSGMRKSSVKLTDRADGNSREFVDANAARAWAAKNIPDHKYRLEQIEDGSAIGSSVIRSDDTTALDTQPGVQAGTGELGGDNKLEVSPEEEADRKEFDQMVLLELAETLAESGEANVEEDEGEGDFDFGEDDLDFPDVKQSRINSFIHMPVKCPKCGVVSMYTSPSTNCPKCGTPLPNPATNSHFDIKKDPETKKFFFQSKGHDKTIHGPYETKELLMQALPMTAEIECPSCGSTKIGTTSGGNGKDEAIGATHVCHDCGNKWAHKGAVENNFKVCFPAEPTADKVFSKSDEANAWAKENAKGRRFFVQETFVEKVNSAEEFEEAAIEDENPEEEDLEDESFFGDEGSEAVSVDEDSGVITVETTSPDGDGLTVELTLEDGFLQTDQTNIVDMDNDQEVGENNDLLPGGSVDLFEECNGDVSAAVDYILELPNKTEEDASVIDLSDDEGEADLGQPDTDQVNASKKTGNKR